MFKKDESTADSAAKTAICSTEIMISPLVLKVKRYRCKEWDLMVDEISLHSYPFRRNFDFPLCRSLSNLRRVYGKSLHPSFLCLRGARRPRTARRMPATPGFPYPALGAATEGMRT